MMTETGLAFLVWREGRSYLIAKGRETPASSAQWKRFRSFFGFETRLGVIRAMRSAPLAMPIRAELVASQNA